MTWILPGIRSNVQHPARGKEPQSILAGIGPSDRRLTVRQSFRPGDPFNSGFHQPFLVRQNAGGVVLVRRAVAKVKAAKNRVPSGLPKGFRAMRIYTLNPNSTTFRSRATFGKP